MSSAPGSPLRGRYLVKNRGWNAALRVTDAILSHIVSSAERNDGSHPRRILVAVGGHLGDAVIATSVLPVLASAFPDAELGMLLPSWSRAVVDGHPRVRWLHHADHWKMNRTADRFSARWNRYRETRAASVAELRAVEYDAAIDLYAYYPNAARLLHAAGIAVRVGYASGGCGPLYTRSLEWTPGGHTAAQHLRLVRLLAGDAADRAQLAYELPPLTDAAVARAAALAGDDFIVVHPGTGHALKQWPLERWQELVARFASRGERVVFTGAGDAEARLAESLVARAPTALNLVAKLDWTTFRAVIARANVVIGADSVAGHVAAAHDRPAIAIMSGMSNPEYWRPLGRRSVILSRAVPCAPCFRGDGCAAMTCVRDVSVDEVMRAVEQLVVGSDANV